MQSDDFHSRNYPYIPLENQHAIRGAQVTIAGLGIGSLAAEGLVRLGFERLRIIDGDRVELSNLNRQNYADAGRNKAKALRMRLRSIRPGVQIEAIDEFITSHNIASCIDGSQCVLNTVDFDNDIHIELNRYCQTRNIPVVFPVNLGWASVVYVFTQDSPSLETVLSRHPGRPPVVAIAQELIDYLLARDQIPEWLIDVWPHVRDGRLDYEPQMHVGNLSAAATLCSLIYDIVCGNPFPTFPQPVFHDHRRNAPIKPTLAGRIRRLLFRIRPPSS